MQQAEPFHEWWDRMTKPPAPAPPPEPREADAWTVEKQRNRLQRQVDKVAAGRWVPRLKFRWDGTAAKELQGAHDLLAEARDVLLEGQP